MGTIAAIDPQFQVMHAGCQGHSSATSGSHLQEVFDQDSKCVQVGGAQKHICCCTPEPVLISILLLMRQDAALQLCVSCFHYLLSVAG